jgi:hypothetical protein
MQCSFEQRGNFWLCPQCGIVVPRTGTKPPRATCLGQWRTRRRSHRRQPTRRERLLARYDADQLTDPPRAEIERRLAVCETCEDYEGYGCITLGSECMRPVNWQDRVLLGSCKHHSLQDGGGENGH